MARPREFNEAEVLTSATHVFWERGYDGTSLTDLLEATGLARGSLYKAFGSKRELYLRVLKDYLSEGRANMRARFDGAATAREALEGWLRVVSTMACRADPRRGCFGVNAGVELGPHDDDVRAIIAEHNRLGQREVQRVVEQGLTAGEFRSDVEPVAAAAFMWMVIFGLQSRGRTVLAEAEADSLVRMTMRVL